MQADLFNNPAQFATWLRAQKNHQGCCSTCGRFAKIYKRRLHATIARKLIDFYHLGGGNDFMHSSIIARRCGNSDFTMAKYWGLISQDKGETDIAKKTNGKWKLTETGVAFVRNQANLPKYAYIYQDDVVGYSDEVNNIAACLMDKGFDYSELMEKGQGFEGVASR